MSVIDQDRSGESAVEVVSDEWERDVFIAVFGYLTVLLVLTGVLMALGPMVFPPPGG